MQSSVRATNLFKVAAITALTMIGYFLLMKLVGLNEKVWLRGLNFFILWFGVRYYLKTKREENNGKLEYLIGMKDGFLTALFAGGLFAAFIFIYLNIDVSFMNYLRTTQPLGNYATPASSALVILLEGISSGIIIAFALMHLWNRDKDHG